MIISFLISLLLVLGISVSIGGIAYLLISNNGIGVIHQPWKSEWLNVGEYNLLSVNDKLKYHKHKGNIAEHIETNKPLIFLVSSKFTEVFWKYKFHKKDDGKFYLDKHGKFAIEYPDFEPGFKNICTKLSDGSELNLSVDPRYTCLSIKVNDNNVGFIIGIDNVIEWSNTTYREEILNAIKLLEEGIEVTA